MKGLVDLFKKRKGRAGGEGRYLTSEQQQQQQHHQQPHHNSQHSKRKYDRYHPQNDRRKELGHNTITSNNRKPNPHYEYERSRNHNQVNDQDVEYPDNGSTSFNYDNDEERLNSYQQGMKNVSSSSSSIMSPISYFSSSLEDDDDKEGASTTSSFNDNLLASERQQRRWHQKHQSKTVNSRNQRIKVKKGGGGEDHKRKRKKKNQQQLLKLLTREELFELPARELRKKCQMLGLDASRVVEKEDLVLLIHEFYKQQSNNGQLVAMQGFRHHHGDRHSDTNTGMHYHSPQPSTMNKYQLQTFTSPINSTNLPLLNDENEQMVEILFEIIPYYGQGDLSIDSIVKDTIQRLPLYCLESKDVSAGNSLMMLACQVGAIDLVSMLLSRGSDPNSQNRFGESCLHFVCYNDSYFPDIAKLLINQGAKAEVAETRFMCTPLHWAASNGDVDLCRILCFSGAMATSVDKSGFDPVAYARQSEKEDCVKFLLSTCSRLSEEKESKSDVGELDELGWEKLLDSNTGYVYYHNRGTGLSMWEDDYMIYRRSKMNGGLRPTASSFSNRPPPPSPVVKSSSMITKLPATDRKSVELSDRLQSKEMTEIKDFDQAKEIELEASHAEPKDRRPSSLEMMDSHDFKDLISDSDLSSSPNSSMIDYKEVGSKKQHDKSMEKSSSLEETTNNQQKKSIVTQKSFNERISSLQSKMEKQLTQQLAVVTEKIANSDKGEKGRKEGSSDAEIIELTKKIVHLQTEIGAKGLEIVSLKREIQESNSNEHNNTVRQSVDVQHTCFGDNDVRDNMWQHVSEVEKLKLDIVEKEKQLNQNHEEILLDLQLCINNKTREIEFLKETQVRGEKHFVELEQMLQIEKDTKNEVIILLEQTQQGMKVDAEIAKSLGDQNRRSDDELNKLREQLKLTESKVEHDNMLSKHQLEETQRGLLCEKMKVEALKTNIENQKKLYKDENQKLQHQYKVEKEDLQRNIQIDCDKKTRIIEQELLDEKELRREKEIKSNEAIQACAIATKNMRIAELELERISSMAEEAKTLVSANEKLHRSLHVEIDKRKALHNHLEDLRGKIRVYVRIRPLSSSEQAKKCQSALTKEDKRTCVMRRNDGIKGNISAKSWEFDTIFQGSHMDGNSQEDVFKDTKRLVTSAIDGFNVCIFAYGQTGSGKTYTIWGSGDLNEDTMADNTSLYKDLGLAPRVACELFRLVDERKSTFDVKVTINMFELYNDNVRDLMSNTKKTKTNDVTLRIKLAEHSESGLVEVAGAVTETVENATHLLDLFKQGSEYRTTASTKMNAESSRSHLITNITVSLTNKRTDHVTNGKMTLVDLAGSERVGKSGATGTQLKEAQSINKSLSALGDVINALTSGSKHIPYRNHPLTMLMSDSMGGNAKTLMFVCCSPADYNCAETGNALDFAKRCKDIKNNVKCGAGEVGQMKALKAELSRLKREKGNKMTRKTTSVARRPGAIGGRN